MATDIYYFTGTCKWAKVQEPVPAYDKNKTEYSICFYPDNASWNLFKESGLGLKVREDKDDGQKFVQFKRPTEKEIRGETVTFSKPEVLDSNGGPYGGLIGNGSSVTVKVSVYDTRAGKGHTLEGVKVTNLIEANTVAVHSVDDSIPF